MGVNGSLYLHFEVIFGNPEGDGGAMGLYVCPFSQNDMGLISRKKERKKRKDIFLNASDPSLF